MVSIDELLDGGFELAHAAVDAAAYLLGGELREPAFDEIQP